MANISLGGVDATITAEQQQDAMAQLVADKAAGAARVLLIPPDFTRFHSEAGSLCNRLYHLLKDQAHVDLMPALGTHVPMTEEEITAMFGDIPVERFLIHDWRNALVELGTVTGEQISEFSGGLLDYEMKVQVNKQLIEGNYDHVFSVGQVVPHEVIGMANYTKNVCIGIGGSDMINKSHFLGAAYGMEQIMGRMDTPVRKALNCGFDTYIKPKVDITFVLTVMEKIQSDLIMRGLYTGGEDAFLKAGRLSQQVNFDLLDEPIKKAVVYLEPSEFKTTWLGNKAVYRLRMAMADAGELIILAPALHQFGEDQQIDELIREFGYRGTPATMKALKENERLGGNLSAAAHLIHGSSEGRFNITYCPGPDVSQAEIEQVGFEYASYDEMSKRYDPAVLKDGHQEVDGETIFYVSNPALGLWALKSHFNL